MRLTYTGSFNFFRLMFQVDSYIGGIKDVPSNWIFEFYLKLPQPLMGQRTMIRSVFNSTDNDPSMSIYFSDPQKKYRFKDFSTGKSGDAIDLMNFLWSENTSGTYAKILKDYREYIQNGGTINYTGSAIKNWKLRSFKLRTWNTLDRDYWSPFGIGSKLLNLYNVKPLESYTMESTLEGSDECFEIFDQNMYGFFTGDKPYKIYRPLCKEHKFIKIAGIRYIQGTDQLYRNDTLLINSAIKDIMSTRSLGLRADFVAPDSENSIFSKTVIAGYKKKYKSIACLLDSDEAGVRAMKRYQEEFNIPFIYLPMSKDISDAVKYHGKNKVLYDLLPKLTTAIEKYQESHLEQSVG